MMMNQILLNFSMLKLGNILVIIGIMVGYFSTIIPLGDYNPELEDLIYFRGIILSMILTTIGASILIQNEIFKSILNAITGGLISLIYYSIRNILCHCVDLGFYYKITIEVTMVGFIIIILIRNGRRYINRNKAD